MTKQIKQPQDPAWNKLAFSVHEAAAALGLSASSIWKWISLGQLRAVRIGGRTVIPADEIQRILQSGI